MSLLNRSTRRYNTEPPGRVLAKALAVFVFLGVLGYLAVSLYSGVPGRDYQYVEATVPNPGSLIGHDPVRIGGVRVGQVTSVGSTSDGQALLRLQLAPGTDLPEDSKILIRANGLLGARFVELTRGRSDVPLAAGQRIEGGEESLTFGATDALDVFDRETRGALQPLVGELGRSFLGQGRNVNDLFRIGGKQIIPVSGLFKELNRPAANERLLPSMTAGFTPLDANREQIAELFGVSANALEPLADRREATRATLSEAPPALAAAASGLSESRRLLASVRTLAARTRVTLPPAPAALRETTALLREAQAPLRKTDALLATAEPAVPAALRLTASLRPVLPKTTELFSTLTPMVDTLAPYGCDITNFGAVFRSMTGFGYAGPGGPAGPAMQFRLQAGSPQGFENLGAADASGLITRDGYPTPCKYLAKEYVGLERPVR